MHMKSITLFPLSVTGTVTMRRFDPQCPWLPDPLPEAATALKLLRLMLRTDSQLLTLVPQAAKLPRLVEKFWAVPVGLAYGVPLQALRMLGLAGLGGQLWSV